MNRAMVQRLVLKDWYFQRWPIAAYLAAGAIAIALIAGGTNGSFYAGTVLMITVMVTAGVSLAMTTVVSERSEQTLPFVMSLPVSTLEYTTAKILANVSIFLLPWTALTVGTLALLAAGAPGMLPIATLTLVEMLTSYCLILMVAIVTESQGWTIGVMAAANLFLQAYLYYVARMPAVAQSMKGKVAIWDRGTIALLILQVVLSLVFLGLAFVLRARRKDVL